jgi:hypothetical protein
MSNSMWACPIHRLEGAPLLRSSDGLAQPLKERHHVQQALPAQSPEPLLSVTLHRPEMRRAFPGTADGPHRFVRQSNVCEREIGRIYAMCRSIRPRHDPVLKIRGGSGLVSNESAGTTDEKDKGKGCSFLVLRAKSHVYAADTRASTEAARKVACPLFLLPMVRYLHPPISVFRLSQVHS